jgi:hypothetical protein
MGAACGLFVHYYWRLSKPVSPTQAINSTEFDGLLSMVLLVESESSVNFKKPISETAAFLGYFNFGFQPPPPARPPPAIILIIILLIPSILLDGNNSLLVLLHGISSLPSIRRHANSHFQPKPISKQKKLIFLTPPMEFEFLTYDFQLALHYSDTSTSVFPLFLI